MKKIGVYLLTGIGVCCVNIVVAQSTVETALMFSRTTPGGSARVLGMGGAQVSLGGDFSSAASNPAGLGMFNRSEFAISPSASWNTTQTKYFGNSTDGFKTKLSIPSLGYAIHRDNDGESWLGGTFAITLSRLNDFNSTVQYQGTNPYNSIADYLTGDSDGINPNEFSGNGDYYNSLNRLAFNTFVIDSIWSAADNIYYYLSPVGINFFDQSDLPRSLQTETIQTRGSQNQWSFSYGANFNDKYFFGAALHIRSIRYENKKTYTESDYYFEKAPDFHPLDVLRLDETLRIVGAGFSGTFGAIIRPVDGWQIGLSYNTPTAYILTDTYTASMSADWNNFDYYGDGQTVLNHEESQTDEVVSDYKLKTPGRISAGTTYFFGKSGFVSADVEVVDYSKSVYTSRTTGISYDGDNDEISGSYQNAVSVRLGGEYRLKDFRFRSGVGFQNDPFVTRQNGVSTEIINYAVGFGYRTARFYADAALSYATGSNSYRPYNVPGNYSPLVNIKNARSSFTFTLGFPF